MHFTFLLLQERQTGQWEALAGSRSRPGGSGRSLQPEGSRIYLSIVLLVNGVSKKCPTIKLPLMISLKSSYSYLIFLYHLRDSPVCEDVPSVDEAVQHLGRLLDEVRLVGVVF